MDFPFRHLLRVALAIPAAIANASEPVIEPCRDPPMVLHVRAEGFPLREEIALCLDVLDDWIFVEHAPAGLQARLPVELRREGAGAVARFLPDGYSATAVELAANAAERRVEGISPGAALLIRLESRPASEDPLARLISLRAESLPIPELVARLARAVDHRVEGAERLCGIEATMHFERVPLPVRGALSLLALECGLRVDRSGDGVIRIDPASDRPWAEGPPSAADRLFAELEQAGSTPAASARVSRLLAQAEAVLAELDPDRIGPEWLALAQFRARLGPASERLAWVDRAIDLHGRLLPMRMHERVGHDRQAGALRSARAEALLAGGRPAEALVEYERAIELDAFEPDLMARADALLAPDQRPEWWRRRLDAADRLLDEVVDRAEEHSVDRYDSDRHDIVRIRASHAMAVEALLAGRHGDAGTAWSHIPFMREERLGRDHRRVRDAGLEYALLVEVSHSLARSPAETPLPDPPLSVGRETLGEDAPLLDRLLDRDLLDAELAAAIDARLSAAVSPSERARLAVLAAEIELTRHGAAGLATAIGHYRTAIDAHAKDDYDRNLLGLRLGRLESLLAGGD